MSVRAGGGWDPGGSGSGMRTAGDGCPPNRRNSLCAAEVAGEMAHVVAGLGRLTNDLARLHFSRLAQRPQSGGTRSRTAEAEDRTRAPLEHGFGLFDHVGGNPFTAERDGMIIEPRRPGGGLDCGAVRLIG